MSNNASFWSIIKITVSAMQRLLHEQWLQSSVKTPLAGKCWNNEVSGKSAQAFDTMKKSVRLSPEDAAASLGCSARPRQVRRGGD